MDLSDYSLNEWITIVVLIAQAGIVYYRLKKMEQRTERFNDLVIEFAVYKNSFEHHRQEFDKHSNRIETIVQKLDDRVAGIEAHAYEALAKNRTLRREP